MIAVAAILALIVAVIWWLTAPRSPAMVRGGVEEGVSDLVTDTVDLISEDAATEGLVRDRSEAVGSILVDLFDRMGLSRADGVDAVRGMGFPVSPEHPDVPFTPRVVSFRAMAIRAAVERGLLVGIELARRDDDYGSVGDDALDGTALAEQADRIEHDLFDEETRRRQLFYSRAVIALQDMVQDERDSFRRATLGKLLERFGGALDGLQKATEAKMVTVEPGEELLWGDAADRRLYYFKMGVTNSLRRSGRIESLGHLYRYQGVNYDVVEAYDLAGQEVPALKQAEGLGIDRVLTMRPDEVHSLVGRGLPARAQGDATYDGES